MRRGASRDGTPVPTPNLRSAQFMPANNTDDAPELAVVTYGVTATETRTLRREGVKTQSASRVEKNGKKMLII